MRYGWLIPLALLALTHGTGLLTVGVVTTDSMTPTMPPGSVFVALPSDAEPGDIVVYTQPDGGRAVHRAVDETPEGLVTKGDANDRTDQEIGVPHVDPASASVVPTVDGQPASVSPSWLKPIGVLAAQALLLTYAVHSFLSRSEGTSVAWPWSHVQVSHLVLVAGILLLATGPFLHERLDATGQVQAQGLVLPTTVHVSGDDGVRSETLAPLETATLPAEGSVSVVRAPAVPGASTLASEGAVWAMLPTSVLAWAGALWLRMEGR